MQTFHCSACQALLFFENTRCLSCGRVLAFHPLHMSMVTLEPDQNDTWRLVKGTSDAVAANTQGVRLCANYTAHSVCNWALAADEVDALCRACRLTHTLPDLSNPAHHEAWAKLETAKRRLVYALLSLELPLQNKVEAPSGGLQIDFLSDSLQPNGDQARVLTGHDDGLITINIAEADDVYREAQRKHQHEPYRTLLGHFRHEIGHYYWDRLIAGGARLDGFRALFGDERRDYQQALNQHYQQGAPQNWEDTYISAYASTHPWEDWAESWAHVGLHIGGCIGNVPCPRTFGTPLQIR